MERVGEATAVVVDDWPLLRLGIGQALRGSGVTVVGAVAGAEEGLRLARARGASVMILGSHRDLPVAESARRAKEQLPSVRVVVLLDQIDPAALDGLRAVGVDALLGRSVAPEELAGALLRVAAGERVVSPALLPMLMGVLGPGGDAPVVPGGPPALTRKEIEVLARLSEGRSNREIAEALFVTPATVKTHLGHIYAKLGVASRQEAMARAVATGLLG
ncbi:MAG: LuxR C-terminal-related transcriptional regulator [Acidimicrobiales bacterium]